MSPICERCGEPIADGAARVTYGPPINGVAHEPACEARRVVLPPDPMLGRIRELEAERNERAALNAKQADTIAALSRSNEALRTELAAARSERDEAVRIAKTADAKLLEFVVDMHRVADERDVARRRLGSIRATLGPLVAKMRAAWAEERRLCEVVQTGAGLDLGDPADMNTACCAYERALSAEVAAEADAIAALTELFPED